MLVGAYVDDPGPTLMLSADVTVASTTMFPPERRNAGGVVVASLPQTTPVLLRWLLGRFTNDAHHSLALSAALREMLSSVKRKGSAALQDDVYEHRDCACVPVAKVLVPVWYVHTPLGNVVRAFAMWNSG